MIHTRVTGQDSVNGMLLDFVQDTGKILFDEVRITARVLAVSLAKGTLPRGTSKVAKEGGERSAAKSINRVLLGPGQVFDLLDTIDSLHANNFWRAYKSNDQNAMQTAMMAGGQSMPIISTPAKHSHWTRQRVFVPSDKEKQRYIKRVQAQVGKAKAGWALAADECGGHRGIPLWASGRKHADAKGGAIITRGQNPVITIYNRVSYIEEAMIGTSIWETVRIAHERLIKRIKIITSKTRRISRAA